MSSLMAPSSEFERTITGLTAGTQYRFRVRARNANGYGPYSAWSTPGTPTAGPPSPPPATVVATVSLQCVFAPFRNTDSTSGVIGRALAAASLSDQTALAGVIQYTWQGRYLRTPQNNSSGRWLGSFTAVGDPAWQTITNSATPQRPNFGYSGATTNALQFGIDNNLIHAPSNYWEMRCIVSVPYLLSGVAGVATGESRVFAFKEWWNGVDYPTTIITPAP